MNSNKTQTSTETREEHTSPEFFWFSRRFLLSVVTLYSVAVIYASLVPLNYQPLEFGEAVAQFKEIRNLNLEVWNRADWIANLLLFIPLGFLGCLLLCRISRSIVWRILATIITVVASMGLAFGVEFSQLWFPPRTVSQNDLRAEGIGSVIGALLGFFAIMLAPAIERHVGFARKSLIAKWGVIYVAGLLAYSLLPGDVIVSQQELLSKIELGRIKLVPTIEFDGGVRSLLKRMLHILCFIPLGYLWTQRKLTDAMSLRSCLFKATLFGVIVSAGIEVLQLPIYSRDTSTIAILFGTAGVIIGGTLYYFACRPNERPRWLVLLTSSVYSRRFWIMATGLYLVVIFVVLLAPFRMVETLEQRSERWDGLVSVPFAALYFSSEFEALTNVLEKGIIFAILGFCLYAAAAKRESLAQIQIGFLPVCIVLVSLVGVLVEVLQVYVDSYLPDLTDVIIYTTFSVVGYFSAAWLGQTVAHSREFKLYGDIGETRRSVESSRTQKS